jgi:hypothetical protein
MEYSDEHACAIDALTNLIDSIDAIPPLLMTATEDLRATAPALFEESLLHEAFAVGENFSPTNATEFVEILNRAVQRDMASV